MPQQPVLSQLNLVVRDMTLPSAFTAVSVSASMSTRATSMPPLTFPTA